MPIYEYECPKHGKFETYYHAVDAPDFHRCNVKIKVKSKKTGKLLYYRFCNRISEMVYSLVSVQPDNCWSGIKLPESLGGGYVTSKKEYNKIMKNYVPRTRNVVESIAKKKKEHLKAKEEKANKLRKEAVQKTIAEFDLPSDYKIRTDIPIDSKLN